MNRGKDIINRLVCQVFYSGEFLFFDMVLGCVYLRGKNIGFQARIDTGCGDGTLVCSYEKFEEPCLRCFS